ncbi:HEPN domain-containing protein [Candidatus Uhrbacteria bacterium]|nr:HEPN domain-containing protein [Candidatus Uhrbacteria bacterium]
MMEPARVFWERAITAFRSANLLIPTDPDGAASRAYYAAFNAVSALFALEGKSFKKHSAVDSAVHRDLVRTGRWPVELGKKFSSLVESRTTGDYGNDQHISNELAEISLQSARRILEAVQKENPEVFPADFR